MTHPLYPYRLRCPALSESYTFLHYILTLSRKPELDMENLPVSTEHHKDWESGNAEIVQSLHRLFSLLHRRITSSFLRL